jgi:F-type H+-transporting ATPase subunit delta
MRNPRLAARYAKSLIDLAIEQNSLDVTLGDMQLLHGICAQVREFENMLRSPIIKADKKQHIIKAILEGRIHILTQTFINLLINKGRESNMPEIAQAFIEQYNVLKNIKSVSLTTAAPIEESIKQSILKKVYAGLPNDSIDLKTQIDESLIGGFVLEVEDKLFDSSIKKGLNDIKTKLLDYSYESKI